MNDRIFHFLIVFDHTENELLVVQEFGDDIAKALTAYSDKEDEFRGEGSIEIVLVGSDSLDSVKATHTNYFTEKTVSSNWLASL